MNGVEWVVLLVGLAAIAWVNWYFFVAGREPAAVTSAASDGVQQVTIEVEGGYSPSAVRVRRDAPVRLVFDRKETNSCSEELVIGSLGVRKFLTPFEKTTVDLGPLAAGTYEFTCGMGMLHGKLVVE
jgi:plastocyanin domain-containing protein